MRYLVGLIVCFYLNIFAQNLMCAADQNTQSINVCLIVRIGPDTLGHAWIELRDQCENTLVSYGAWPGHDGWTIFSNHPKDHIHLDYDGSYRMICINNQDPELMEDISQYVQDYKNRYKNGALKSSKLGGLFTANCAHFAESLFDKFFDIRFNYQTLGIKKDPMLLYSKLLQNNNLNLTVKSIKGSLKDEDYDLKLFIKSTNDGPTF